MLTQVEYNELVGLLEAIEVVDCFSVFDILRRNSLEEQATEEQIMDAYKEAGVGFDDSEY